MTLEGSIGPFGLWLRTAENEKAPSRYNSHSLFNGTLLSIIWTENCKNNIGQWIRKNEGMGNFSWIGVTIWHYQKSGKI